MYKYKTHNYKVCLPIKTMSETLQLKSCLKTAIKKL